MPHCCGPRSRKKPKPGFEQEEVRQPEAKGKGFGESFWQKLLKSLGLRSQDKDTTGED